MSTAPQRRVGAAIKKRRMLLQRKLQSFTQEYVAHEAGLSLRHYQKIEAGSVDIRVSTLFALARVLSIRPQALIARAGDS